MAIPGLPYRAGLAGGGALPNVGDLIAKSFEQTATQYKPKQAAEDLLKSRLMNAINKPKAERADEFAEADLQSTLAGTGLTNQNAMKQGILNSFLKEREPAEIEEIKQRGKYYGNGGSKGVGGVSQQNQIALTNQIKRDNPNLSNEQVFEAAGNLVQGREELNDGTPFHTSGLTRLTASKAVMQGNTTSLVNQQTQATQAEAEIPVIDKYITEGIKPYGNTIGGISPAMTWDALRPTDKSAQERLGKKVAADFLQFDRAALSAKMSGTQSGVTIVNEMMDKAGQHVRDSALLKTSDSRQVALDTIRKALNEMVKARKSVGILNAGLVQGNNNSMANANVPVGKVRVYFPDGPHVIPKKLLDEAIKSGATMQPEQR